MKARAILILGMHRSGTSAVTRMLNLLGVSLGRQLKPAADDNPRGFWEHESVVKIHEKLLSDLGMSWDDPRLLPADWLGHPSAVEANRAIVELVATEFGGDSLWAAKDPRMCRFVPLWRDALTRLDIEPCALLVDRNPYEVADSLKARNGLPTGVGALLWMRHLEEAELATRGLKRSLIDYESILTDWRSAVTVIEDDLDLRLRSVSADVAEVDRFLAPDLRHHHHSTAPRQAWLEPLSAALLGSGSTECRLGAFARAASELESAIAPHAGPTDALAELSAQHRRRAFHAEQRQEQASIELARATEWGASRDAELIRAVQQAESWRVSFEQAAALAESRDKELRTATQSLQSLRLELEEATRWGASRDAELIQTVQQAESWRVSFEQAAALAESRDKELRTATQSLQSLRLDLEEATRWGASRDAELIQAVQQAESWRVSFEQAAALAEARAAELRTATLSLQSLRSDLEEATSWGASRDAELVEMRELLNNAREELAAALAHAAQFEGEQIKLKGEMERVREENEELLRTNAMQEIAFREGQARIQEQLSNLAVRAEAELGQIRDTLLRKQQEVDGLQNQATYLNGRLAAIEHRLYSSGLGNAVRRLLRNAGALAVQCVKRGVLYSVTAWPGSGEEREARVAKLRELNALRHSGISSTSILADVDDLARGRWPAAPAFRPRADAVEPVDLDVSVVVYHSEAWVAGFMAALYDSDYPANRIHLYIRDHGADNKTLKEFEGFLAARGNRLASFNYTRGRNAGYGAGHNFNFRVSGSNYFLVCNVDGRLRSSALSELLRAACNSRADVAAWELRQAPYEHPKYYDPVTMLTTWVSGASVLFRRDAYDCVGGFDDRIFMYGEDVDLSYRLRGKGFALAYVPTAVYEHDSYSSENQFKALQFHGSSLANILIRLRFGALGDLLAIPAMWRELGRSARAQKQFAGYLKNSARLLARAPGFFLSRRAHRGIRVPFMRWDYGLRRDGAFERSGAATTGDTPLVSIVVRTFEGRADLLRQALASIANQTYGKLEVIVVQDKGSNLRPVAEACAREWGLRLSFLACETSLSNRCVTGNLGLAAARGEFACFLDDDDLLFADHIEFLLSKIVQRSDLGACYSLAWETKTIKRSGAARYAEVMHSTRPEQRIPFNRSQLMTSNYIPIQCVLFRTDLFRRYGGFNEELDNLEDWNLWRRYSWKHDFAMFPKTTSIYHVPAERQFESARQAELDRYYEVARLASERACMEIDRHALSGIRAPMGMGVPT